MIFTDGPLDAITASIPLERLHRVYAWARPQRERGMEMHGFPDHVGWEEVLTLTTTGSSCPAVQRATRSVLSHTRRGGGV